MKLLCQQPTAIDSEGPIGKGLVDLMRRDYDLVRRSDTEPLCKFLERGITRQEQFVYPAVRLLNDAEHIWALLGAKREGFDGVIICCCLDPGLAAAKTMLDIPVVGAGESTMHFAAMMGLKFANITTDVGYIGYLTDQIHRYGMSTHAIERNPVRAITLSEAELWGCLNDVSPLIKDFSTIAKGCIEDGAEVLIAGCGIMSAMLTLGGLTEVDGVPIMDVDLVSIKVAEILVDLHKAKTPIISRKNFYSLVPAKELEALADTFKR
ncbi:aspartate/glutamate racemase family protein [Chloroflexota bacterium]